MKYNVHERNTQLTIIAHFDLEKRSKEMISDKLQTAFNRAVVPEMNCYFCYQPLFSFYQGTVEIMRHGVILRLVLESRLRHLRFWLICNITWDTNINKQTKKHFSFEHIECGMREETYRQAAFDLSLSPSQSLVLFIICVSVAPRMISHFERNVLTCLIWSCLRNASNN